MTALLRQSGVAARLLLAMTVLVGLVYPAVIWLAGRAVAARADGSFVTDTSGRVVGSSLIGQNLAGERWFQPRPSAAGTDGYDAMASSGSNYAADNPDLLTAVDERRATIAASDGVPPADVPPDALLASGSGLDPDISPAYAAIQVDRVARANGLSPGQVQQLVTENTSGRALGFIGEPRVNVLRLNLALQRLVQQR